MHFISTGSQWIWSPASAYAALKSFLSVLGVELLLKRKLLSGFMTVQVKSNRISQKNEVKIWVTLEILLSTESFNDTSVLHFIPLLGFFKNMKNLSLSFLFIIALAIVTWILSETIIIHLHCFASMTVNVTAFLSL